MLHFHCLQWQGLPSCLFGLLFLIALSPQGGNPDQIPEGKIKPNKVKTCFELFLCHLLIDFKFLVDFKS